MDGQELVDAVREGRATQLDRLGSDKYLIAATGADLEPAPVLRTLAESAASGRATFDSWAAEANGTADGSVGDAFEDVAAREADHFDRVVDSLVALPDDGADASESIDASADPMDATLAAQDGTVARVAAGFVGRPLVADRTRLQVVNFFVNEADESRADLARDIRSDAQSRLDEATAFLDDVCAAERDWDRARAAAESIIGAAYEDYAERLESMGVDPKPVC